MSASQLVQNYLAAMEARDLPLAQSMLAPAFSMQFPGPVTFTSLAELIEWAKPRYRFVRKTYERFDQAHSGTAPAALADAGGEWVVYCFGTLVGEWPDGRAFGGIRFIDRFTVKGGLLVDQTVWNDLAEVRTSAIA